MNGVTKSDLISWIEKSLNNENFLSYDISLVGQTEKGDGYIGEISFANVVGATSDNGKKELNLVIKYGKSNDHMRQKIPVRDAFEVEIHFYNTVIPAFRKLQEDHKVRDVFDSVPKCYMTLMLDKMEVLVLGNLKKLGYDLHDRKKPLHFDHQKLVVIEYGKLHALSFAFKDQRPKEFNAIVNRPFTFREFIKDDNVKAGFQNALDEAIEILEEKGDSFLVEAIRKRLVNKNAGDIVCDLLYEEIPQSVITHGDCWNNNFMFKYENNDQSIPSKVVILDWQMSAFRSPVFDLSHFIYCTSSSEQLEKLEELLDVYYKSFSSFLRQLGSDPDELFPLSALKAHWTKYSIYGLLFAPLMMKFVLCDKEDVPDMADLGENDSVSNFINFDIKNADSHYDRVKPVLEHYFLNNN